MRKPGFGQRPTGGRSGRGGSGEGRGFGGKRPSGGGGKDRFEGRRGEGRGEARGENRGEARGERRFGGDRKPRFEGEGGEKAGRSFKPRDGKRPFKRDGDRAERSEAGGGFRKGPRPFRHGEDRGEYSSKPPRERDGFKKRPFRSEGEGARSGEGGGERGERRFEGRPRFERKGPPRERFGAEGERSGERGGERGERRFEGRPRFERKGPPRERFGGEGERRGSGSRRDGLKSRDDRGPRDRTSPEGERGGRTGFKTRPFDKGQRPFEARGDRPPRRDDRPERDDRPHRGERSDRGDRPQRGDRPPRREREDRFQRERPPVGRLLPDRDEQADRAKRPQDFKRRDHDKGRRDRDGAKAGPAVLEPMRIAKAMARAGLCSRREAERWIEDGRVSVNGEVLKTAAYDVKPKDRVLVDGKPLPAAEPPQLWRYYKPKGLVTTHHDPEGRPTVFENLPPELPRVVSVGRLDFNTEGLILLTNDGELARHLELPATGWLRRYRVRAKGRVDQAQLDTLKDGIEVEGVRYGPVEATLDSEQGANVWLSVGIREGKNREVRKVLGSLGLEVNRLIRISFGPFQLLDLKPGEVERVRRRVLFDQLGPQLAAELGIEMPEAAAAKPQKQKSQKPKPEAKADEPEWQLLEETDIDLNALEADDTGDDVEDAAGGDGEE